MSAVLEARELGRWYGQVVGLSDLSVAIRGGITGLIGPNGAGKSTFLKLIAGELRPSRGSLRVLGLNPFANRRLYHRVGFCPQQDSLYGAMSGRKAVRFLMRLGGYSAAEADDRARRALAEVGMEGDMDRRISTYSKGMRQRTKIAQAIAHEPELLVLDEPLSGLDPVGRHQILGLLRRRRDQGTHVLISSHVLHEVETLTEEILLLHRGRLLAQGVVPEVRRLLNRHPSRVELRSRNPRELARALIGVDEVVSVKVDEGDLLTLETKNLESFHLALTRLAAEGRHGIRGLENVDESLEAIFDYLVG